MLGNFAWCAMCFPRPGLCLTRYVSNVASPTDVDTQVLAVFRASRVDVRVRGACGSHCERHAHSSRCVEWWSVVCFSVVSRADVNNVRQGIPSHPKWLR